MIKILLLSPIPKAFSYTLVYLIWFIKKDKSKGETRRKLSVGHTASGNTQTWAFRPSDSSSPCPRYIRLVWGTAAGECLSVQTGLEWFCSAFTRFSPWLTSLFSLQLFLLHCSHSLVPVPTLIPAGMIWGWLTTRWTSVLWAASLGKTFSVNKQRQMR